ncbi:MAG: carbon storage regulator CsrA [Solirubrobacteraceae bacterium]|jgi:carbon storage regulator
MLNITRRRGERIVLGDDIFVSVLEISGQTVRLGIDAPRSLRVYREELWLEVKRENEAAAHAADAEMPPLPDSLRTGGDAGRPPGGGAVTSVTAVEPPKPS